MAKFDSPMRMTSPSFRFSRASSASSTAAPNIPSRSPSAPSSDMGGAKTAWPMRGHDGSTALISIKAASPPAALAMPRNVATVDSEPCASRKRCSSAERRRWMSANEASPPRITRPSRPMPSLSARARLSTPTIAATPSAMERRKMRKPARPPRRSRKAKRRIGARLGRAMSPVAGAFTASPFSPRENAAATPFFRWEKVAATPFSPREKVAGEACRMREPHQSRTRALRPNPHPQPLSRWRGECAAPVFHLEKMAATPFSLGEKVAGEARRMRESRQSRRRVLRENPHPQPLSRWRGGLLRAPMSKLLKPPACSCRKRRRGNGLVFDPARTHADHPVATRGERGVMRDKRQRRSAPRRQIEHHVDDGAPGRLVEIAGRLVRDQKRWPGRERAGQRHALLLAPRQLRRIVAEAVGRAPPARVRPSRARLRRLFRRARAGPRRFRARSWSESGERTGTRCRCAGRESARGRPRSRRRA